MVTCRKCGKEMENEEENRKNFSDDRRGKIVSDKICSECN